MSMWRWTSSAECKCLGQQMLHGIQHSWQAPALNATLLLQTRDLAGVSRLWACSCSACYGKQRTKHLCRQILQESRQHSSISLLLHIMSCMECAKLLGNMILDMVV